MELRYFFLSAFKKLARRVRLAASLLFFASLLAPSAGAQTLTSLTVSVSPGSIVGGSFQVATMTVNWSPALLNGGTLLVSSSPSILQIPGGFGFGCCPTDFTFGFRALPVLQPTVVTLTVALNNLTASTAVTVMPFAPKVTITPASIVGGSSQVATATVTWNDVPLCCLGGARISSSPPLLILPGLEITVNPGDTSLTFGFRAVPVSQPTTVTLSVTVVSQTASATIMVVPPGFTPANPVNNGAPKQCEVSAGSPINLTTGNVWIQQRDSSLPGLAGGLELVRTWNGQWQDVGPPELAGMFGHSWRANYEEKLTFPDVNTIKYWRGDGSAWTFTFNSATGVFSISSPPDERASVRFDSILNQYTLALADGSKRLFSQPGLLTAILDRNGNRTSLTYDASNRITQVTDPAGRAWTFTYGDATNPRQATSMSDSLGVMATYTYDANSRLTRVTYADNSTLNFAYDANSLITSVTDTAGKVLESHTYDSQHRGLTSQRAFGADSITLTYPTSGPTQLSDSMGNVTSYGFQTTGGRNFVTSVTGSGCASCGGRGNSTFTYDTLGNRTSSTDALGHTTTFTYDAKGNVQSRSIQLNSTTTLTWSFTYNQFNQVLTATDPLGNTTTNTYDANGNLLSTATPPPATGQPPSTTTFQYDAKGQLVKTIDPLGNATTIAYTPVGLIASTTDASGKVTTFAYDARGNRTSTSDALLNTTTFTYDVMNRLTKITQADGSNTSFAYDNRGRRISVTDANGKLTAYQYDDADRLVSVTDAAANLTAYGYDTENHLASITDALGRVTNFAYDPLGRVTKVTFSSTLAETYTYDAVGNLVSKTDRKAQTIAYTYDALDRLTRKQFPDTTGVNYTYDALSRLTQAADPTGTYSFAYDNLGRLTQTTTNYSFLTSRTLVNAYSYDAGSNRISFTNPEAGVTSYTYDTLNRLTGLRDFGANAFTFSYDALGRRTSLNRPNLVNTSYTYDALSRLLSVVHQQGLIGAGTSYTYDAAGNRTSRTDSATGAGQVIQSYTYDSIYQLTQAVVSTVPPTTTETYSYDKVGNRLSSLGVSPYSYNTSNQLTSKPGTTYAYDANGNALSKTDLSGTTSYSWDFENRLASVALPGTAGTVTFKYDPFGRRVQKGSATGTTVFAYDGDNIIEELSATGLVTAQYTQGLGIDEPLAMYRAGAVNFYHADGLGSISALTDTTGTPAAAYVYDSFGNTITVPGSVTNPFRYTAREFDAETGLYYYRARYYDSALGRFTNEDPIGFVGGLNFYRYVNNNVANFTDPFGRFLKGWHYQTTLELAQKVFGNRPGCQANALAVAEANKNEDELLGWRPVVLFFTKQGPDWERPGAHFPNDAVVRTRLENAFNKCDFGELGRGLHSLQDGIAHSGPYANPTVHYVTGPLGDVTAQYNHTLTEAARSSTESILRSFKQKCLKCCQ